MKKKQSSLDYLIEQLFKTRNNSTELKETNSESIIQQAKQMHNKEVISFAKKCLDKALDLDVRTAHSQLEELYNETFGGEQC